MEKIKLIVSSTALLKTLIRVHYDTYTGNYEFTISVSENVMCCFYPGTSKSVPFGFNVGVEVKGNPFPSVGYYSMDYRQFNKLISILSMINDQPITLVLDTFVGIYLEV